MMTEYCRSRIGSEWLEQGHVRDIRNPADIDETIATVVLAEPSEADRAVRNARSGFDLWRRMPLMERSHILLLAARNIGERSQLIARAISREQGKILTEAVGEVQRAVDIFSYFAGEVLRMHGEHYPSTRASTEIEVVREPVGVVLAITPWNFPVAIPATKIAAALAYGNSVVLKPSEVTPVSTSMLVEAVVDAGVPESVLTLLIGDGQLGRALAQHPGIDAISFTGSVQTGRNIRRIAADTSAELQLELGGKNALIVLDDADPAIAAQIAADGAFLGTGQRCTASSIALVTPGIRDLFLKHLRDEVCRFTTGDPFDAEARIGPVVSASHREKVQAYLERGRAAGYAVTTGPAPRSSRPGYFVVPHLFENVDPDDSLATDEIFGPVLAAVDVNDLDTALKIANRSLFGLSAGICTHSLAAVQKFKREVEAGIVTVNLPTAGSEPHVPFGGIKQSSHGPREISAHAASFFTRTRTVYISCVPA
ncbi:aldehyde dehydrogenase family protein [Microvirga pudoricolor]|uniref:aldehyde dehydrogenase family protein n=1 Tax=Microvirga pudoricolor TaxID=2778729 RepID=UPI0019500EF3|nr:aldehyde dehydrogenase family protein [Microvirga pudoricolor]MBM6595329.1 aldehyde dehydrogenase family protein [Microvirga pudoricolor]